MCTCNLFLYFSLSIISCLREKNTKQNENQLIGKSKIQNGGEGKRMGGGKEISLLTPHHYSL
jgi:hypothetical protein